VFKEDKGLKDSKEDLVQQDLRSKVTEEIKDLWVIQEIKDHREMLILGLLVIRDLRDLLHQKVSKVLRDQRVSKDLKGIKEPREYRVIKDHKETKVIKVRKELRVLSDRLQRRVPLVLPLKVLKVHKEPLRKV
jgi:hypothetical protein